VHFVERLGDLFGGGSRRLQLAPGLLTKHGRLLCVVLVLGRSLNSAYACWCSRYSPAIPPPPLDL
jgi:hypothetical protein